MLSSFNIHQLPYIHGSSSVADADCAQFMSITGEEQSVSASYLEMAGGSLDVAVSLFFDRGDQGENSVVRDAVLCQEQPAARCAPFGSV